MYWNVLPISSEQKQRYDKNMIFDDGSFVVSDNSKSELMKKLFNKYVKIETNLNFFTALVTRENKKTVKYTTAKLIDIFISSKADVLRFTGKPSELGVYYWNEILEELPQNKVFYSSIDIQNEFYTEELIDSINHERSLYSIIINGADLNNFNDSDYDTMLSNVIMLDRFEVNYYFTLFNAEVIEWQEFSIRAGISNFIEKSVIIPNQKK